jgi:hypothetical protein
VPFPTLRIPNSDQDIQNESTVRGFTADAARNVSDAASLQIDCVSARCDLRKGFRSAGKTLCRVR